jgi:hypothetical protein
VPRIAKLDTKNAFIYIVVAKPIGALTGAYHEVVRRLEIQGKTKIPDVDIVPDINAIDF